jgi:hypothetical protein
MIDGGFNIRHSYKINFHSSETHDYVFKKSVY